MNLKVVHLLYSGLSGTASVVFAMIEADTERRTNWHIIFYGIEDLSFAYRQKCEALHISYHFFKKEKIGTIDSSTQQKIFQTLQQLRPSVLMFHGSAVFFAAAWYRRRHAPCKLIGVEHQANDLKRRSDWFITLMMLALSDAAVFLSREHADNVAKRFPRLYRKCRTAIIPNGINTDFFKPAALLSALVPPPIVLGMQCRLTSLKDIPTIFKALLLLRNENYYPQLQFRLAGDGDMRESWQQMAADWGIGDKVVFEGLLNEEQLLVFLQNLSIYVHSTFGETMSIAIMQAQAVALPIVASRVKGVSNALSEGETALLFELGNAADLAQQIDRLVKNATLRRTLGDQARRHAEIHLSSQQMLAAYRHLMNEL
ncbi:MAG: glycosyltransferase family 4 protein [Sphingobacteriales bacterium]|nr:glycosyltransferase family 4 protein [Sphingobacteriales bacterium]